MKLLPLIPLFTGFFGSCFTPRQAGPASGSFNLVYQSNVGGEIEPCG
jgi:hypothetical protein